MRKRFLPLILSLIVLFAFNKANAVTASWNYVVTGGPSAPINMTGATVIGAGGDDVTQSFKWPFSAVIYDDVYTVTNDIYINTNGIIRFDGALWGGAGRTSGYPTFPTNSSTYGQCISWGGNSDGHVDGKFVYKVTGTTGSRVLTIAFKYYTNYTGTSSYNADIQISYYEANHNIKVDYSNVGGNNTPSSHLAINAGDGVWGNDYMASFPTQDTSFTFAPGATFAPPASFSATAVSSYQINLAWTKNSTNADVMLVYNTTNNFANPVLGQSYSVGSEIQPGQGRVLYIGSATSLVLDTLPPNATRYFKIWSKHPTANYYSTSALTDNATTNPLPPPGSFTATAVSSEEIDLSWALNTYGDSVIVTYNTSNNFANPVNGTAYIVGNQVAPGMGTVLYKGTATSFSHINLPANTQYYYKIWSYNKRLYYSTDASANATTQAPANPQSFTATASGSSLINLVWQLNALGHNVIIAYNTTNSFGTPQTGTNYPVGNTIGGPGTGTVIVNGSTTSFAHSGLSSNTTYYYKIWSYDAAHNYSSGLTANATTSSINDPSSFTATAVSSSSISLAWSGVNAADSVMIVYSTTMPIGNPTNGTSYLVGGSIAPGQTVIYRGTSAGSPFVQTGLTPSTKYYYKIWA